MGPLHFVWAEITGRCQLTCTHCYAESGPRGEHGTMSDDDWRRVIDESAALGTRMIQFIGGEPTLHPALPELIDHALGGGLDVEVFTNLVSVSARLWRTFGQPGVRLATSYYADDATQHEAITGRPGSHTRTRANIEEAVRRAIPLRVGLIEVDDRQRVGQAHDELRAIGVTHIGKDRLRHVGRGVRGKKPDISQLCGACARGKVAVTTNGDVWPCVFARWITLGNVKNIPLADILASSKLKEFQNDLGSSPCAPDCAPSCLPRCNPSCYPVYGPNGARCSPLTRCEPSRSDCHPHCPPGYHSDPKKCWPYYYPDGR